MNKQTICYFGIFLLFFAGCGNDDSKQNNYANNLKLNKQNLTIYKNVNNLRQIEQLLSETLTHYNAKDILVIFDFNYTLMHPISPCLHKKNINQYKQIFVKILKQLPRVDADKMLCKLMAEKNQRLVNEKLPLFFKNYEAQGVNFLVCSSSLKNNVDSYVQSLRKNGIKITNSYNLQNFEFSEFKEYATGKPTYKDGCIVTNREEKGAILVSFIKRISRKPKLVIFVDNSTDKLEAVKNAVSKDSNIQLIIVEYLEYGKENIKAVSENEFRKYWNERKKEFELDKN